VLTVWARLQRGGASAMAYDMPAACLARLKCTEASSICLEKAQSIWYRVTGTRIAKVDDVVKEGPPDAPAVSGPTAIADA
jgi:hypothetical protein